MPGFLSIKSEFLSPDAIGVNTRLKQDLGNHQLQDINDNDWDSLFGAIEFRLGDIVREVQPPKVPLTRLAMRAAVFDCVDAMNKLQTALRTARANARR